MEIEDRTLLSLIIMTLYISSLLLILFYHLNGKQLEKGNVNLI